MDKEIDLSTMVALLPEFCPLALTLLGFVDFPSEFSLDEFESLPPQLRLVSGILNLLE